MIVKWQDYKKNKKKLLANTIQRKAYSLDRCFFNGEGNYFYANLMLLLILMFVWVLIQEKQTKWFEVLLLLPHGTGKDVKVLGALYS